MLIYLYGFDTFRSRQQLKLMIEKFKKDRDPQGFNVARLDCEKEEAGKIMEQMLAMPFLAERRMVVLENLLVSKHKDLQEELFRRIEVPTDVNQVSARRDEAMPRLYNGAHLPESNVIIFWEGTDTFKTKPAKALAERLGKEKYAQRFDLLKGVALGNWITNEVKERGGAIAADAVRYLAENAGGNMWRVSALIDQLTSFVRIVPHPAPLTSYPPKDGSALGGKGEGGVVVDPTTISHRPIALADTQLFLDEKADDNIFNLVDAIVGKQPKQVYQMIQEQYRKGEDVQFIFAMILRQFRILLEMRDLFERDDTTQSHVMAQKLKLHPFVVKKSLPLVRRYTMAELKKIYEQILELDVGIKSSRGKPEVLLDVFVGRVCVGV